MAESPSTWAPLADMPDGAERWETPGHHALADRWNAARATLKSDEGKERFLNGWLRERVRAFAIETGQIEGLYTLRRGITEQLIAEGFAGAVGSHTVEAIDGQTLRGLLDDQEAAYDMMFDDVASGRALSEHLVKSWHQLLTRHQATVPGIDPQGRRVEIPFTTRGAWKVRPNNPMRPDGLIHEYCPPEQVQSEMDRFFAIYDRIQRDPLPVNVEAAWLHHRFVQTHPFQDGNGRVSRLLMAWAYIRRDLPPPIVTAQGKPDYIAALERADAGNLKSFSDYLGALGLATLTAAADLAEEIVAGNLNRPNGNGGRTVGDTYLPPDPAPGKASPGSLET